MTSDPDHERIRETEDRSWTSALVELVRSPSTHDDDHEQAFTTLAYLEDHRSVGALTALVKNRAVSEAMRREASAVLRGFDDTATPRQRRAWWASGDQVLMEHALGLMTRFEADIVTAVAGDDRHPLQALALGSMAFGYDEPQFQPVKTRALDHPDPAIREAAAEVLLWDEPVAAEDGLLRAAADPSARVAVAAVDTLQYYASQRVLRALSGLLDAADERVRAKAAESFDFMQGTFEAMAEEGKPEEVQLLREWMEPVRDLVNWPEQVREREQDGPPTPQARVPISEKNLRDLIDDLDGEWAAKKAALRNNDWDAYDAAERDRLAVILTEHPDPLVRDIGCAALAAWSKSGDLLTLTGDASFGVRKSAMYHLGLVPRDLALAELAWTYMAAEKGTTAYEGLRTYVAHADPDEAGKRLADLVRDDAREAVVTSAISSLVDLGAATKVEALLALLDEPPGVTWAVHIELLGGARKLGLPVRPLDDLAGVDNLHLIRSVVAAQTTRNR